MAETILVVDDEVGTRELMEAILTREGYRVDQVENGAAALTQATSAPPDLILLDLMMPGMNGLEVCQRLKQDPGTASVPVIVVTALGQIKDKEVALTSGADDFVTKPVDAKDLLARVRAMLRVRRIRQDLDRTLAYLHELDAFRHAQRRDSLASALAKPQPRLQPAPTEPVILLVDDESLTRDFYSDFLAEHGFQVLVARDGVEGLNLAAKQKLEAAILDIMMPGMSGLEVLERLHAQDPDLPVIMLTAFPSSQNAIAALKLGAFDFIAKGLSHELVLMAVHRAVRHHRETLARREEVAQLRSRIGELEDGRTNRREERLP